ncbi:MULTISPECIES: uracil-xanthine permease family protein [unclassified Fusibacter]|uniref:uracil-xanthine permease family protein n=1 Tax=unclassified Fusibacter TaxID=2624464 RepID=UPI001010AC52|nr:MULTISPECIES: solute carrier family 23 protein [unclassified Fusibacter]MCK8059747.1 NCS2 family nucleobase:cation symporter [Fusibacter sp. A2]NPE21548.1 uracil permease [Fusibacter sp. A1]RXV61957.1 uracil permease [Fusibacter sp. A1]
MSTSVHAAEINAAPVGMSLPRLLVLGLQHVFTMFGATVLVPMLTGLNVAVCLFMAGAGTLLFHLVTKGKVPAFLGSSFAFLAPIFASKAIATEMAINAGMVVDGISGSASTDFINSYVTGGIVVAGLVYLVMAGLIALVGVEKILKFFPPVVTGPIIMVIGLKLAPVAIGMAGFDGGANAPMAWLAFLSFAVVAGISVYAKGFLKVLPVMMGLLVAYLVALATGNVDFTPVVKAAATPFALPGFTLAKFDLSIVLITAPVALATMVEHIGDVIAIGETTGKDYIKEPGLQRTLIGDGLATSFSAMFGGPANTTYSENTGVLALTKAFDVRIMQIAAAFAMILGLMPPVAALIQTIPTAVVGGTAVVLFGMIASVGAKSLVDHKVNFNESRNLIVAAVILVLGLGGAVIKFAVVGVNIEFGGLALAALVGILLNAVLPETKK